MFSIHICKQSNQGKQTLSHISYPSDQLWSRIMYTSWNVPVVVFAKQVYIKWLRKAWIAFYKHSYKSDTFQVFQWNTTIYISEIQLFTLLQHLIILQELLNNVFTVVLMLISLERTPRTEFLHEVVHPVNKTD